MNRMRRQIAEHLRRSNTEHPTISSFGLFDFTELLELKEERSAEGKKLLDTAIFIKATALTLKEHPVMNSRIEGDEIITYDTFNAGFAVDTPRGLIVLVLHDVLDKSVEEISDGLRDLLKRLREGALTLDDYKGSTFTISNMSKAPFGSFSNSILNNDECIIVGIGGIHKSPMVVENDEIAVRQSAYVTLNYNHAIVDGVYAHHFLERLKEIFEHPKQYM